MKSENVTFTITCTMKERWVNHFFSMLKYMEQLGDMGSSRKVSLYVDGDGDFRPEFTFSRECDTVLPVQDVGGNRLYDAG